MNFDNLKTFIDFSIKPSDLTNYGKDWSIYYPPNASAVVFPEKEEQLPRLLDWAWKNKTALVPSGGRTGLSGAATATNKEVVVSFERMNKILDFNEADAIVKVQPGVITETLQNFAKEKGYFFPIDFAAKGSSQIGGNVATNAGGVRVLKYGMMRNWVAGLTVITGKGEKLQLGQSLIKNATGLDLKNIFIGSEGTLGLFSEIDIKLTFPPKNTTVLVVGLNDLKQAIDVYLHFAKKSQLSACEVFSDLALSKVLAQHDLKKPFETACPFYLLLEVEHDPEDFSYALFPMFEHCMEKGWVSDGVISQSPTQKNQLWSLREFISESLSSETPYKNDVSVRISQVPAFVKDVSEVFKAEYPDFQIVWFGHIGDGNLHLNILKPESMDKEAFVQKCHSSDKMLFQIVQKYKGAISAEHGVGLIKKGHLTFSRSPEEIQIMKEVKKVFDPKNLLNPGKIFD